MLELEPLVADLADLRVDRRRAVLGVVPNDHHAVAFGAVRVLPELGPFLACGREALEIDDRFLADRDRREAEAPGFGGGGVRRREEHRSPAVALAGRHEVAECLLLRARLADRIADTDRDTRDLAVAEQHPSARELERLVLGQSGERGHARAAPLVEEAGPLADVGVMGQARDDRLQQQGRDEQERGRAEELQRTDERARARCRPRPRG